MGIYREGQNELHRVFIYLAKAYDNVSRGDGFEGIWSGREVSGAEYVCMGLARQQ